MGNIYKEEYEILNNDKLSSIVYINKDDYREKYYYMFLKLKKIKHGSTLKSKFLNAKLSFYDIYKNECLSFNVLKKIFDKDFESLTANDIKKIVELNKYLMIYCDSCDYVERYILTSILFVRFFLYEVYGSKINF